MSIALIVLDDFSGYREGDVITDSLTIASILSSGDANFVVPFDPNQVIPPSGSGSWGGLSLEVDSRDFNFRNGDDGSQDNGNWPGMIAQVPQHAAIIMPFGDHLVPAGTLAPKSLLIKGQGTASGIKFIPSSPGDILLVFTNNGAPAGSKNDDGQLVGAGFKDIKIWSDRSVRANGVYFDHCDQDVLNNVQFWGLDGFSVDRNKARECKWSGTSSKYCGHPALTDPMQGVASFVMRSNSGVGDTTNLCMFENFDSEYSFWDCLALNGCSNMYFGKTLLHALIEGSAPLEQLISNEFGGTPGWAGGVPNNQFAALHTAPSSNAANVTGAKWLPSIHKAHNSRIIASSVVFGHLRAPGFLTGIAHRIDQASNVKIISGQLDGAENGTNFWTSATFTADPTANTITFASPQPHLFTRDPVLLSTTGVLPGGLTNPNASPYAFSTYWVTNVDSNASLVYKLSNSYNNSEAGINIDLTDAGTGVHTLKYERADVVAVLGGSTVTFDDSGLCSIANGRNGVYQDRTSTVTGNPFFAVSVNDLSLVIGPERPIHLLKDADLRYSVGIDQQYQSLQAGHKVIPTRAMGRSTTGSSAGTRPYGGIYTGPGKTGLVVVDPEFDWSAMAFGHWMPIPLSDAMKQAKLAAGTILYQVMDYAPNNGLNCHVVVYGINSDGPG